MSAVIVVGSWSPAAARMASSSGSKGGLGRALGMERLAFVHNIAPGYKR
jgi:hypothetical protein